MDEYSRIIIEEYCMNHPKTKKADFLWEMVHMSLRYVTKRKQSDMMKSP